MKFHKWNSLYDDAKTWPDGKWISSLGRRDFYKESIKVFTSERDKTNANSAADESLWYDDSQPYYKVYPCILESLEKIRLDLPCEQVPDPPFPAMAIRYCTESPADAAFFCFETSPEWDAGYRQIQICANISGHKRVMGLRLLPGGVVEDGLDRANADRTEPVNAALIRILRQVITICLLAEDPSVISSDVLAADREKYDATKDQKYVDKARRRGVVGWSIGADYEVCPHYRRPHFALRHTGKGRTVPRIVPVTGCVVHRSKLTEVPTGYILPDGTEVEDGKVVSEN